MELFKSGLKSVLGAQQPGAQPTGADTVERLLERVQSSTLLEDRRDACRAIKAMSRKYRVEVGAQGMDTLVHVLEADRGDSETVGYVLDTLYNIVTPEVFEEEEESGANPEQLSTLGEQFTEIFIKKSENVVAVLGLMEEFDFHVRWPAVKLLTNLLTNRPREIQEIVLVSPMGVSKLVDLLSDSREVIRNDALLLLIQLTKSNANIQKIVAFENAFDRLFDVIAEEGYSEGGIVVEDCLTLMLNLLRNNTSNQTFFKEGSFIQRLSPLFALPQPLPDGASDPLMGCWSAQKVSNLHYMLALVRTLVSPSNPAVATTACQKVMKQCSLLEALCTVLMANGVPADILTETVSAVGEVIRACQDNQEHFGAVVAPSTPPRPAIVVLLMSMVNDKQPFVLRGAVLYCFQCFLCRNELGQAQIVQTLLPATAEAASITAGQLLCGGLFSPDSLSTWLASVALSYTLVDNTLQKEQLLRVQLATGVGSPPVSLLQQCTSILQQSNNVQTQMGILILLCSWLAHCPVAVGHFLNIPSSIPYLTSQVGATDRDENQELGQAVCAFLMGICILFNDNSVAAFTKDALRQLIAKRIGVETYVDRLGEVSRHELYSRVAKHPQLACRQSSSLLLDHEFCRLFKALEGQVVRAATPKAGASSVDSAVGGLNGESTEEGDSNHPVLVQYKGLIREQDQQIREMREELNRLSRQHSQDQADMEEMRSTAQELRDQNALLMAQRGTNGGGSFVDMEGSNGEVQVLRQQLQEVRQRLELYGEEARQKDITIRALEERVFQSDEASEEQGDVVEGLKEKLREKEAELQRLREAASSGDKTSANDKEDVRRLRSDLVDAEEKLQVLRKDQEDLLELLTDQDTKINEYKKRLKALGEKFEDDDEDEEADLLNEDEQEQ